MSMFTPGAFAYEPAPRAPSKTQRLRAFAIAVGVSSLVTGIVIFATRGGGDHPPIVHADRAVEIARSGGPTFDHEAMPTPGAAGSASATPAATPDANGKTAASPPVPAPATHAAASPDAPSRPTPPPSPPKPKKPAYDPTGI
jgi:hypothetical protein